MLVFELSLRLRFMQPVRHEKVSEQIANLIDGTLGETAQFLQFHENRDYKYYCFDQPYPCERDGVYQAGKIYTVRIRTVRQELAEYLSERLVRQQTAVLAGSGGELRILPRKLLEKVYTLTPLLLKTSEGYWRGVLTPSAFESRLKTNLIKKYNQLNQTNLEEDFSLYRSIHFQNRKPIAVPYKNITLLGDKICLTGAANERSQELLYMALGTGIGENNARGNGFLHYRYL